MIAVVGAGGGTGLECVKQCLVEGTPVRAVVRSVEKYEGKFGKAEVVKGDVTDEASLKLAFEGCSGVVFAASASSYRGKCGPHETDYLGVEKAVHAASAAGVGRFVLVTSRFVNPVNRWHPIRMILNNIKYGLMDKKFLGEEVLRRSGLEYCIVRPGGLTGGETSQRPAHAEPGTEFIIATGPEGDSQGKSSIHRADVAAVICEAFRSTDAKGKTVEIVGRPKNPDDPSFEERVKGLFKDIPIDPAPEPGNMTSNKCWAPRH